MSFQQQTHIFPRLLTADIVVEACRLTLHIPQQIRLQMGLNLNATDDFI